MSAITYEQIKIDGPWEITHLENLKIKHIMNQHATLHLQALLTEESGAKAGMEETVDTQIKVYVDNNGEKYYIFIGRLKQANVSVQGGTYILTADFLSETVILDRKQKSRSFQNTSLTYADIVKQIMQDYTNYSILMTAPAVKIDGPLIQYNETDFQFIQRIASLQETIIVPEISHPDIIFTYGYPQGGQQQRPDNLPYGSGKDLKAYFEAVDCNPNMVESEFAYFEVETYEKLTMGDRVTFQKYPMVVGAVNIALERGLLVYTTKLVREMTLRQNPIYNDRIQGVSLEGKVLDVRNQEIKLHLTIDQEQDSSTAYWYPFVPPTVDMMYLMPQIGTNASLYIPGLKEQNAIITGCVRTNGETCQKTSDPSTRYLGTNYGQELKMAPGGIYFTAGRDDLALSYDDEEGVKISSHKEIKIEADQEIIFKSKKKVAMTSPNLIRMVTASGGFSMENEVNFNNFKTHITCPDANDPSDASNNPEDAQEDSVKSEGFLEGLGNLVRRGLSAVGLGPGANTEEALSRRSDILTVAAIGLGAVGIFCGAPLLVGASAAVGVLSLINHGYAAFATDHYIDKETNKIKKGEFFRDVGWDVVGIVTCGAAKAVPAGVEAGLKAMKLIRASQFAEKITNSAYLGINSVGVYATEGYTDFKPYWEKFKKWLTTPPATHATPYNASY